MSSYVSPTGSHDTFETREGPAVVARMDSGVVAVQDSRILTKNYGRSFLRSIPKCRITDDREEFRKFFEGLGKR